MRSSIIVLIIVWENALSANILGLFPMPSMGHVRLGMELTKELAAKGHNITMITPYPQNINEENYREISLAELDVILQEHKKLFFLWATMSPFEQLLMCYQLGYTVTKHTFENPDVQDLLQSDSTFDVVIMDQFYSEPLMAIAHHFRAPIILSSSIEAVGWTHHLVGNPEQRAFLPHIFLKVTTPMTFLERLQNVILIYQEEVYRRLIAFPYNNKLLKKYMPDAPHLYDLMYNVSLIFINSHYSIAPPSARLPNLIHTAGFHLKRSKRTITQSLKALLDNSTEGVIYFAMGSNLLSSTFPQKKQDAFLKVFSKLKQKVLWKYEDEGLVNRPDNLVISKWWPQPDILSHPNTKVFISHGGILSTIEATVFGVPILGIPIYGDQPMNIKRIQQNGHALMVPYDEITETKLTDALNQLLYNKSYKDNARRLSQIFYDRPVDALDEMVFWVEYVIRHKGNPYMRSPALDLNWFQQNCYDIYAFLLLSPLILLYAIYKMLSKLITDSNCDRVKVKVS